MHSYPGTQRENKLSLGTDDMDCPTRQPVPANRGSLFPKNWCIFPRATGHCGGVESSRKDWLGKARPGFPGRVKGPLTYSEETLKSKGMWPTCLFAVPAESTFSQRNSRGYVGRLVPGT